MTKKPTCAKASVGEKTGNQYYYITDAHPDSRAEFIRRSPQEMPHLKDKNAHLR
ncbi:MAG: hypothetical protein IT250_16380 [Chitinophagaceae bacterium]|nr:hypothetical protein [Chitinophagaceae bacterium]